MKSPSRRLLLFCLFFAFALDLQARLDVSPMFSDDMVLQRNTEVPIWGTATPGSDVEVNPSWGDAVTTRADGNADWILKIPTPAAGGPHTIRIQSGESVVVVSGVLIGEVWLCSGQSNMGMNLTGGDPLINREAEIAAADYPQIRMFRIRQLTKAEPSEFISKEHGGGVWKICNPENVRGFSAAAYFFGRALHQELEVPIGLIHSSWGTTGAESWLSLDALKRVPGYEDFEQGETKGFPLGKKTPTVVFNGMVNPVIPYAIKGAIWYQGESNTDRPEQYTSLFSALVGDWRDRWGIGDFPFYYVQIAPYDYSADKNSAELREAQRQAMDMPNTGMVVTLDIGEFDNIHPSNKQEVGRRLALQALARTYGRSDLVYSGPVYTDVRFEGDLARLSFDHIGEGLVLKGNGHGFELAGADGIFHPAKAHIEGETLVLKAGKVEHPQMVRYAWSNTPEATLFNKAGLPASSFQGR